MIGLKLVHMSILSLYCAYIIPMEKMHILLYKEPPIGLALSLKILVASCTFLL